MWCWLRNNHSILWGLAQKRKKQDKILLEELLKTVKNNMIFMLKCFRSPSSVSSAPSLSSLPPCIIPLIMCQCNFGVQDVSSLKRMCVCVLFFFLGALFESSSPPLTVSATHSFTDFLFPWTYHRLYAGSQRAGLSQLVFLLPSTMPQWYIKRYHYLIGEFLVLWCVHSWPQL